MAEKVDDEIIMKAACIQAAATSVHGDAQGTVLFARRLFEEMEKQGYYPHDHDRAHRTAPEAAR